MPTLHSDAPVTPDPNAASKSHSRIALHWQILAGLAAGILLGIAARIVFPANPDGSPHPTLEWVAYNITDVMGQIFLRLIIMVVVPLVFSALVLAIVELGDVRKLGRMGLRTLLYTAIFSSSSVIIGILLANTIRPGDRVPEQTRKELSERYSSKATETRAYAEHAKGLRDTLLDIIPKNPLQEMVGAVDGSSPGGGMLSVMFFSLAIGIALSIAQLRSQAVINVLQGIYDAVMVIIEFAMRLAPLGVAGLIFSLTARFGFNLLSGLVWYVAAVLVGLLTQALVVYPLALSLFAKRSPLKFFGNISDAMVTAFATSSSSATLPTALQVSETQLKLKPEVSRFVLTIGATANQNGTALYEGITVLFLAQVFGRDLDLVHQIKIVLMSILAGIGTAGVPGGSLPLVIILLNSVGVSGEAIAIILGIDRLLDMCRTTLNVTGDLVVAACVDKGSDATIAGPS